MKTGKNVLVVSPNWLGDAVMAMPGLQRFIRENRDAVVTMLCRPALSALWNAVDGIARIVTLDKRESATLSAARRLRSSAFNSAFILPNSFRSAIAPMLAAIPHRRGTATHARRFLINDPVRFDGADASKHQCFEYAKILCGDAACDLSDTGFHPPAPPPGLLDSGNGEFIVGIVPGAARGPSKRWPWFAEAAQLISEKIPGVRFAVFGGRGEEDVCSQVATATGGDNFCGRTNLAEFASCLSICNLVLCNDSGGMHLAHAAGTPLVAVFGLTDPEKTGPIGGNAAIVRPLGVHPARAIARNDQKAIAALASIPAKTVAEAALKLLKRD